MALLNLYHQDLIQRQCTQYKAPYKEVKDYVQAMLIDDPRIYPREVLHHTMHIIHTVYNRSASPINEATDRFMREAAQYRARQRRTDWSDERNS